MYTFETWAEDRKQMDSFTEYRLVNELIKTSVETRSKDAMTYDYRFPKCIYDKKWSLTFNEKISSIAEFSFNCLKVHILHNNKDVENYRFFSSVDLFFKYLQKFDLHNNKTLRIKEMLDVAKDSDHHKAPVFIENMKSYLEKENIISKIETLL